MNRIKTTIFLLLLLLFGRDIGAQTADRLNGKWLGVYQEEGEKIYITYEFRKENESLNCYAVAIADKEGNKEKCKDLVLKHIIFENGKGSAKYIYTEENEKYEFRAKIVLKDKNTLEIRYVYWGYTDTETWQRI